MNMKNILIIILLAIFLILATTVGYSLILSSQGHNKSIPVQKISNDTNNSINITNTPTNQNNNQNNKNNTNVSNTNNNVPASNNKEESPYKTPDGKPRTSHPQNGYTDARRSMNAYSDYVDGEGKYDPWTMGKYETNDGNILYFNKN